MTFLNNIPLFIQITVAGGVLLFGHSYLAAQRRLGSDKAGEESNEILRGLNQDLKNQLIQKQQEHERERERLSQTYQTQLDSMQKQISALQGQVVSLQSQNTVLQNTVTGKDLINKLQVSVDAFAPYIKSFDGFINFNRKTEDTLRLIMKKLDIKDNRVSQ